MSIKTKKPGRPKLKKSERRVRIDIRLAPSTIKLLDAQGGERTALIEAAILSKYTVR